MKNIELLAPAGSLTKLKYAVEYGADAIYIGGEEFSLRVASQNFTIPEIKGPSLLIIKTNLILCEC